MNQAGILFNVVGFAMLFRFGFPQPSFSDSVGLSVEDGTVFADGRRASDIVAESNRQKARYRRISLVAFGATVLGSALQFIATF